MAELLYLPLKNDANLKAYWRFYAGALLVDSSGNSKTLSNENSVAENSNGKYTGCADFGNPNTNKSLYIADDIGLSRHAQSISFWLKLNAEISSGELVFFGINSNANDDGIELAYQYNSGTRRLRLGYARNGISFAGEVNYNITLGTSNWVHVVCTWTGDNTSNGLKLYINNSLAGQATASVGAGSSGGNQLAIGKRANSSYGYPSCLIDDFCVFDKVLSTDEISSLYNDLAATINYLKQYRRIRVPGSITGI